GIFVHEKHCKNTDLIRFAGWWGHDKSVRFKMEPQFKPMPTAEAWQLSNAPVISMACHKASLKIFNRTNMQQLREKSKKLTGYLDFILKDISSRSNKVNFEVITPEQENERGCQLSILTHGQGKTLFETISKKGVVADWREPNVIRVAPVPLYNSFEDIYRFGQIIEHSLE
ncbi:MAG: kynureninase, partial [Bacteroidetes bacterium]